MLQHSFPGRAAPRLLRPINRTLFLNPVLKSGRFGKGGKSPGPFQPSATPALLEPLTARLQAASDAFETDLSAAATSADATVDHPFFGRIPLTEYLRFQAIHTRHHQQQLSPVAV